MKVWLDDVRTEPAGWIRARTASEAIAFLEAGGVDEISLDHDLEPAHYEGKFDARTGIAVAYWIRDRVRDDPNFARPIVRIHSMNPVGATHIRAIIAEAYGERR